jgi:predicted small metal-binding protein
MPESKDTLHFACASIVPDCPFTASAATEEELINKVAAHAAQEHNIREISPELAAKVKAEIKSR